MMERGESDCCSFVVREEDEVDNGKVEKSERHDPTISGAACRKA